MAAADLRRVKHIAQKDKDIVYGYMKRMQSMFPDDMSYYTIGQLIQDLCLLYFHIALESKILTYEEGMKLMEMVNNHRNIQCYNEWKLLFRGSRDGLRRKDFFDKCDKMDNTLCIIQTPQNNVFGGYTSLKWDRETPPKHFSDPLSYGKLDGQLYPAKEFATEVIQYYPNGYLSFGSYGSGFFIHGPTKARLYASRNDCFEYDLKTYHLNGEKIYVDPTEIEVFQIEQ